MPRQQTKESNGLHYIGGGSAFPDIPGRDLTADELGEISQRLIEQAEREAADRLLGEDEERPPLPTARSIRQMLLDSGLYIEATAPAPPAESE